MHPGSVVGGSATSVASSMAVAFQELTRNEGQLVVHACTVAPPHILPLVAARLHLPTAPVRAQPPPLSQPPLHGSAGGSPWLLRSEYAKGAQERLSTSEEGSEESSCDEEGRILRPTVIVDGWLRVATEEGRPLQLAVLRARLNAAFAFKVCRLTLHLSLTTCVTLT